MIISGASEAVMDKTQFHYKKSIFSNSKLTPNFWNPKISWKNKWKGGKKENGEKFFLSSSLFVSITDAWHLFKMIRTLSLSISIFLSFILLNYIDYPYLITELIMLISLRIIYGISFTLSFNKFFTL